MDTRNDENVSFPRLLTCHDVAEILSVPVSTVHHWAIQGVGPNSFKVGKHRRYAAEDVRRWLTRARGGAA